MTPVSGPQSAQTMLAFKTWKPGHCLEAVWNAYSKNGAQDLTGESEPTAYDAWLHSNEEDRRYDDFENIPNGVPVYFGPKASSSAGDIVISIGDGWCVATDIPGKSGTIGQMKLSDRQAQIQRPYLGWTTTILDYPIAYDAESLIGDMNMKTIEVWSCPAWESSGQRVITNGTACQTYPAGWAQMLINKNAEFTLFDTNNDMLTAVSIVWELNGLSDQAIIDKMDALKATVGLK